MAPHSRHPPSALPPQESNLGTPAHPLMMQSPPLDFYLGSYRHFITEVVKILPTVKCSWIPSFNKWTVILDIIALFECDTLSTGSSVQTWCPVGNPAFGAGGTLETCGISSRNRTLETGFDILYYVTPSSCLSSLLPDPYKDVKTGCPAFPLSTASHSYCQASANHRDGLKLGAKPSPRFCQAFVIVPTDSRACLDSGRVCGVFGST